MNIIFRTTFLVGIILLIPKGYCQETNKGLLSPEHCSEMSHDPQCWKEQARTTSPPVCHEKKLYKTISFVDIDSYGKYFCKDKSGYEFSCHQLIQQLGTVNIQGLRVEVIVPYIDTCHVLGACGERACLPQQGYALLSL